MKVMQVVCESTSLDREYYETRLGYFLARHPLAIACAQALIGQSLRYMQVRAQTFATSKQQTIELERLILSCGQPLDEPFAGRIGMSVSDLARAFHGDGNIRELVTHTWRFMNNIFSQDFVGPNRIPEAFDIARKANFNIHEIQRMLWKARCFHAHINHHESPSSVSQLNPKEDFLKMPWATVRQAQDQMRFPKTSVDHPSVWSHMTRAEFEAEGGVLSRVEQQLLSKRGKQYVPWMDGRNLWALDETHPFVRHARKANIPLMTGLSGFTLQTMQFARMLNVGPDLHTRLMCLGYLLPIQAHSFHEVMAAATSFGCVYQQDKHYQNLAPLLLFVKGGVRTADVVHTSSFSEAV